MQVKSEFDKGTTIQNGKVKKAKQIKEDSGSSVELKDYDTVKFGDITFGEEVAFALKVQADKVTLATGAVVTMPGADVSITAETVAFQSTKANRATWTSTSFVVNASDTGIAGTSISGCVAFSTSF